MLANRHLVVALLVAPVLSLLAWFGVGRLTGEQPAPAEPGRSYPLVEQPGCRWESGACELRNATLRLRLELSGGPAPRLTVGTSHPLEGVQLAVAAPGEEVAPLQLEPGPNGSWRATLPARPAPGERIRLVARAAGSVYFGEAATAFARPPES